MATGDIVVNVTTDKRQFTSGVASITKDLRKVQSDIAAATTQVAAGNRDAFGSLVQLIQKEEELGRQAKHAADIERLARMEVVSMRQTELHLLAQQEVAEREINRTLMQRTQLPVGVRGGGGTAARGGLGFSGLAFGLSDAATAAQFGGARGASLAIANNLPQIGAEVGAVAARFAQVGGTLGRIAGGVARLAGPLGLVASVGLPLATIGLTKLYEKLTEGARVMEGLDARLESAREKVSADERLAQLRKGSPDAIAAQKEDADKLERELAATREARRTALRGVAIGLKAGEFQSDTHKDDLFKQAEEATLKIRELERQVADARRLQQSGEAVRRRLTGEGREYMGQDATLGQRTEYGIRQARERAERRDGERLEQQRLRDIEEESMRRSVLASLDSREGTLQRQREGLAQSRRSFNLPELATRGNSMDKQIEMAQAKREAAAESQRKMQIDRLDKMIEEIRRVRDAIGDGPTLKPARVG